MDPKVRTSKLVSLPTELLLEITKDLPLPTLYFLHLTSRHFHHLLVDRIVAAIPQHAQHVMRWSVCRNMPRQLTRALDAGGFFHKHYMLIAIKQDFAELLRALFAARPAYKPSGYPGYEAFASPVLLAVSGGDARWSAELPPLHFAAEQGAVGCVRVLLDAGARPGEVDADGNTAMDYALRGGFVAVAEVLLDAGAGVARGRAVLE